MVGRINAGFTLNKEVEVDVDPVLSFSDFVDFPSFLAFPDLSFFSSASFFLRSGGRLEFDMIFCCVKRTCGDQADKTSRAIARALENFVIQTMLSVLPDN